MNDDEYGRRLLRPLATEPPTPTRIDTVEAMRLGRRARRTRFWSRISGLTAVTAAAATGSALALTGSTGHPKPHLPPDPTIPSACTAVQLPTGGTAVATVTGGDPSGTYLVGTTNPNTEKQRTVLVWRDGKLVASVPRTGRTPVMSDINASGVAVGSTSESPFVPYIYRDNQISRLPGTGMAQAINDAGMIAGTRQLSASKEIPVRWAGPDAQPEVMKLPDGALGGKAVDITADGTVVVRLSTRTYLEKTYLWLPDGTVRPIGAPPAGKGQTTRFWAVYSRFGWLYGDMAAFESPRSFPSGQPDLPAGSPSYPTGSAQPTDPDQPHGAYAYNTTPYRYNVASGVWQKLPKGEAPQMEMSFITLQAYIGRQLFTFPAPAGSRADDGFQITFVSDDGRTAGGGSLSQRADPNHRDAPFLWHCT